MASFSRIARPFSTSARLAFRPVRPASARLGLAATVRPNQKDSGYRGYSTGQEPPKPASSGLGIWAFAGAAIALGGGYYYYTTQMGDGKAAAKDFKPTFENYQEVYNAVAKALEDNDQYEDGSYGPILLRLAWHCSGTYDKVSGTGGSNGATMRFDPEATHGANAGLVVARDFLEPIKAKFPWISYGDLWTLAGVCAVQEMQGPVIPWRPGRADMTADAVTPDGRLPDAAKGPPHIRDIFYRMGFNDQEIVALVGAHALGRCHRDRSGYDGPWTFSPTVVSNDFYTLLLNEKWNQRKWDGPMQYQDKSTKSLMMLPTDMAMVTDKKFKQYVEKYAADNDAFFRDFSAAVTRLFELGVPFTSKEEDRFRFKSVNGSV